MLGLAGVLLFLYVMVERGARLMRAAMVVMILALAAQSALTFSRTGLYLAASGMALAGLHFLSDRRRRASLIALVMLVCVVSIGLLVPQLNELTRGKLISRFADADFTRRDELAARDVATFVEHPMFGVGAGLGAQGRGGVSAHTELTRLVAEHGIFGLAAVGVLLLLAWQNIVEQQHRVGRGVAVCLTGWAMLFMTVSAMRLVAPAFLFGLAASQLRLDSPAIQRRFVHTVERTPRRSTSTVLPAR